MGECVTKEQARSLPFLIGRYGVKAGVIAHEEIHGRAATVRALAEMRDLFELLYGNGQPSTQVEPFTPDPRMLVDGFPKHEPRTPVDLPPWRGEQWRRERRRR